MSEFDNTNRGSVWRNERKELDTHADFAGSINVEGVDYFLDAWKRKPDANPKAPPLTFRVKRKDKQEPAAPPPAEGFRTPPMDFADDDIPF